MDFKKFFLILLSSILFNLSLFFTKKLFFCVFLFLIPLYYLFLEKKNEISYKEGFLWGFLFWSVHFYYLFILINEHAYGSFKFLTIIFLVFYFSLYSGLWFYLTSKINFLISTVLYFIATNCFSLIIL